jgi:large subunit ribosomal protein L15
MAESEQKQPLLSRLRAPAGAVKGKRRLGRGPGSGLGTTGGKGQKGQKARVGGKVRRGFEGGQTPIMRRLPKGGFKNIFAKTVATVNVGSLGAFEKGATVVPESLIGAGLIRKRFDTVKILGEGKLDKALTVRAHAFSKGAKAAIEQAGGSAEVIATPAAGDAAGATGEAHTGS